MESEIGAAGGARVNVYGGRRMMNRPDDGSGPNSDLQRSCKVTMGQRLSPVLPHRLAKRPFARQADRKAIGVVLQITP
jgi:hypothetical protein